MKTLQELRNEFAKEKAYKDWDHFIEINQWKHGIVQGYMDEAAMRYVKYCIIECLEICNAHSEEGSFDMNGALANIENTLNIKITNKN